MMEMIWRNALYYLLLLLRHPFYALLPALLIATAGTYTIMKAPRPFYSEGLMVMEFQQIPSSLVSPTVANDGLRFIEQRVLSRANLVALAERLDVFPEESPPLTASSIANAMRDNITLRQTILDSSEGGSRSASVVVGFKHSDPQKAVDVASHLIAMVVDENRRLRQSRASEATQFLRKEVDALADRLERREGEWTAEAQEQADLQPGRLPTQLIDLQARQEEIKIVQQALSAGEAELRLLETQVEVGLQAAGPAGQLKAELDRQKAEFADKQLIYTPQHPQMRQLRQKLDEAVQEYEAFLQRQESDPAASPSTSLPADLSLLVERLNQAKPRQEALETRLTLLQQRSAELKEAIAKTTVAEKSLERIEAEREALQRNLDDMKARLATAMMGERLEQREAGLHIEVLEQPTLPTSPSGPRRLIMLAAVAMVAAGAGMASLIIFDFTDRRVRGAFDLATVFDGHTVVMVPHWSPLRRLQRPASALQV